MDTKSSSSKQVRWAQELLCYHFWIDYRQDKANGAADILSWYFQQSVKEEKTLRAENVKILHRLQLSLARVSGFLMSYLSPLHQILIYRTTVFSQLNQFWTSFWGKIALDSPYASVGDMRLRLLELQNNDKEAKVLRSDAAGLSEG